VTTQSETLVDIAYFSPDGSIASESNSGLLYSFHVAGLGIILQATGRFVFDADGNPVFEAGPHDFADQNTAASAATWPTRRAPDRRAFRRKAAYRPPFVSPGRAKRPAFGSPPGAL
jgi:hypothetical protein